MFNSISLYNLLLDSESNGVKFEAKGTKKIKDRLAYVVEVKNSRVSARLYFDAELSCGCGLIMVEPASQNPSSRSRTNPYLTPTMKCRLISILKRQIFGKPTE